MNIGNARQQRTDEYYDSVTSGLVKCGAGLGAFTFGCYEISLGVVDGRNYTVPERLGMAGMMVGFVVGGGGGWAAGKLYEGADRLYISLRERICVAYEQYSRRKPSITVQDKSSETISASQPGTANEQIEDKSPIKTLRSPGDPELLTEVLKDSANTDGKVCAGTEVPAAAPDVVNDQLLKEEVDVKDQHENDDVLLSVRRLFASGEVCVRGVSFIKDQGKFQRGFISTL